MGNADVFKRANVLIKQGHSRKQAFAIAYFERPKQVKAKKNPAPKRKTAARTQKAAVGYVNRPSQITKKSPTKRLKIRRAKNLQSPRGVFPNPVASGIKKISHPQIKPRHDDNVYVRESSNGTNWLTVAVFPSQKAAIEYAHALDRKHGGRKYIEVFTR